jgi:hypothetical protein
VLVICLWCGFGSAPTPGRFGGSPEPETGESPAAAIFVFEIYGRRALECRRSLQDRVSAEFDSRVVHQITGTNSGPSSTGKIRACQSRNAVSIYRWPLQYARTGGVGSGERGRLISARDRADRLEREGSIPSAPTISRCGETRGLARFIPSLGRVRLAPPQPISPSWCSCCAQPPEERWDAVGFGGSAPKLQFHWQVALRVSAPGC